MLITIRELLSDVLHCGRRDYLTGSAVSAEFSINQSIGLFRNGSQVAK